MGKRKERGGRRKERREVGKRKERGGRRKERREVGKRKERGGRRKERREVGKKKERGGRREGKWERRKGEGMHTLSTFYPHICRSHDGKDKQKQNEHKRLQVVCCDPLHAKKDGPKQFTL